MKHHRTQHAGWRHHTRVVGVALCLFLLAACQDDEPVRITEVVDRPRPRASVPPQGTDAYRLRLSSQLPQMEFFKFDLPDGWTRTKPTANRNPNFAVKAAPDVQVYTTVIAPKAGNTLVGNLARWYRQMSLDADSVDEKTVAALPEIRFVGRPAHLVDLRGTFRTRGGKTVEQARLLAYLQELPNAFVTLKMVGPGKEVDALEADFRALATSFKPNMGGHASRSGGAHGTPPQSAPRSSPVRWKAPGTWSTEPPNSFLLAAFRPKDHPTTRCTISRAGGDMTMNLDRWRRQMSLGPMSPADVAKLPTRKVLGQNAFVVTMDGDFAGAMRQPAMKGARLLGLIVVRAGESLFVKMLGPKDVMEKEAENFFALCDSLTEDS